MLWTVLNLLQAAFTPLDPDETYYWMYASRLDWGYFDHPPAVAVLIALGKDWLPGTLGLRFGHVLISTATIAGMWLLLGKPKNKFIWLVAALVFAQPFLNVYGFIATPDGPLLFFTVLYLLAYRRFLTTPSTTNGAIWGVTMAGLLYSKYHGVMLIAFSVLPHLWWLLRQPGAWVAALGGAALYAPHLYWQYANDFPSFRYHLSGRNDAYQIKYTTEYVLNQLVIFSPLLLWYYLKSYWNFRKTPLSSDRFARACFWLTIGFLVFFLYSTTKGGTEAQWTALLSMPVCYLTHRMATEHYPDWIPYIKKLGLATILIMVLARLLLMAPRDWLPFNKPFDHEPWAKELQDQAEGLPVMVQNSYRFSSLYEFYTGQPAWTFTDVQYRLNQYDLWTPPDIFHNQPVYLLGQGSWERSTAKPFRTQKRNMLTQRIEDFQLMSGTTISGLSVPDTLTLGQSYDYGIFVNSPRQLNLNVGNLPLSLFITLHYDNEEMRFWRIHPDEITYNAKAVDDLAVSGTYRLWNDCPLGPAEVEFGFGYQGMPPLRGQSRRFPVIIMK